MTPRITTGIAVLLALVVVAGCGGRQPYRVDAVFDTAEGVAPGFVVKVAGVQVGKITAVHLRPDLKARVELELDHRFAPFRADASCRILPQSLISEKFVDCRPGHAAAVLRGAGGAGTPTVGVRHTQVPVSVQDVLDMFAQPTTDRLRILLDELGAAVAGRSDDLNQLLRRANPLLGHVDDTLRIVNAQRAELRTAIAQSDTVVAALAAHRSDVRAFVSRADDLVQATARRRVALGAAVRDLPALLGSARRSFGHLRRTTEAATPLLADLRAAAPRLEELTRLVPPFAADATPAVAALGDAARAGRQAARAAAPVVKQVRTFAGHAGRPVGLIRDFLLDLRDRGGIEGTLRFFYTLSSLTANYDRVSHLVTAQLTATPCLATPTAAGCDGRFVAQAQQSSAAAVAKPRAVRAPRRADRHGRTAPAAAPWGAHGPAASVPSPAAGTILDQALGGLGLKPGVPPAGGPLDPYLLDFLFGR